SGGMLQLDENINLNKVEFRPPVTTNNRQRNNNGKNRQNNNNGKNRHQNKAKRY
ncbi:MAG: DUF4290 domain-containing protein, partial [Pedobacter sp.]